MATMYGRIRDGVTAKFRLEVERQFSGNIRAAAEHCGVDYSTFSRFHSGALLPGPLLRQKIIDGLNLDKDFFEPSKNL